MNTIKKIMKNVSAAAIAVMLMGGVFAFASQSEYQEPTHYLENNEWLPLEGMIEGEDFLCEESTSECTAYIDPVTQAISNIKDGDFVRRTL